MDHFWVAEPDGVGWTLQMRWARALAVNLSTSLASKEGVHRKAVFGACRCRFLEVQAKKNHTPLPNYY